MAAYFIFFLSLISFGQLNLAESATMEKPVPVYYVSSLSCCACARKVDEVKELLDRFTREGKISVTFLDFPPPDIYTLYAVKISHAFGPERHYEIYHGFLKNLEQWHQEGKSEEELIQALKNVAIHTLGLDPKVVEKCFQDDLEAEEKIFEKGHAIVSKHNLQFVPAFIVNDAIVCDASEKKLVKALEKVKKDSLHSQDSPL